MIMFYFMIFRAQTKVKTTLLSYNRKGLFLIWAIKTSIRSENIIKYQVFLLLYRNLLIKRMLDRPLHKNYNIVKNSR
jgi:hypothetical protein